MASGSMGMVSPLPAGGADGVEFLAQVITQNAGTCKDAYELGAAFQEAQSSASA